MRLRIFEKAKSLKDKVVEKGTGRNLMQFMFEFTKPIDVSVSLDENMTMINCTCKNCSLYPTSLCSYKLAVIGYLLK